MIAQKLCMREEIEYTHARVYTTYGIQWHVWNRRSIPRMHTDAEDVGNLISSVRGERKSLNVLRRWRAKLQSQVNIIRILLKVLMMTFTCVTIITIISFMADTSLKPLQYHPTPAHGILPLCTVPCSRCVLAPDVFLACVHSLCCTWGLHTCKDAYHPSHCCHINGTVLSQVQNCGGDHGLITERQCLALPALTCFKLASQVFFTVRLLKLFRDTSCWYVVLAALFTHGELIHCHQMRLYMHKVYM